LVPWLAITGPNEAAGRGLWFGLADDTTQYIRDARRRLLIRFRRCDNRNAR